MRSTFISLYNPLKRAAVTGHSSRMTGPRAVGLWRSALLAAAIILYAVALSNQAYEATSPGWLPWHVLLRKTYSIGAFALIGFLLKRSRLRGLESVAAGAVVVGLYSTAIEIGQYVEGVREGLASSAFDVFCGIIGGALGAFVARIV
jgi:hypothetical protein